LFIFALLIVMDFEGPSDIDIFQIMRPRTLDRNIF
jgi:hypothetical protein